MKKLGKVRYIVVHCTATWFVKEFSVAQIRAWHQARGFEDIGYHYVVHKDGSVEAGRDLKYQGAHVKGYNDCSVSIAYVGGLDNLGRPQDTRTDEQKKSLISMLQTLKGMYPDAQIVGHRDLSPDLNGDGKISPDEYIKACPCFDAELEYAFISGRWGDDDLCGDYDYASELLDETETY